MEKAGNLEERIDSECSSGCQSGWTLYLGRSQDTSAASLQLRTGDEEEDLSMLSDASSGPPLVREKRRSFEEEDKQKERAFSLEDTASSPLLCCYKATNPIGCRRKKLEMLEQSCSLSKSHFKGEIELEKQLGYMHSFCTCESSTGLQRR